MNILLLRAIYVKPDIYDEIFSYTAATILATPALGLKFHF